MSDWGASSAASRRCHAWELVRELGRGASTVVYRARPAGGVGEGDYALKMLAVDCQHDRQAMQMLQREAYVARQVQHAHLTTVLASELETPPYCLAMPLFEGATLKK